MHKHLPALLLLVAASLPVHAALPASDSQGAPLPTLAPMLEQTVPAVVNIFTRTRVPVQQNPLLSDPYFRRFFNVPEQPRERVTQSLGSGVVMDAAKGYIITNHHVIDGAHEISVNLADGRTLQAELVGSDEETDVAVIKVAPENLHAVTTADSDQLRVGDFVVAIGNPFGLGQTVTSGIVSAVGRSGLGIEGYEDFIQTDASINPGNSGGALVNLRGELVGINTAILSQSGGNVGIGFAIPINMAKEIMAQLIEHGEVRRGVLGAQAQDLTPELAQAFGLAAQRGAVVTQVTPGSPADKAGLKSGDIITQLNGRAVRDAADVRNVIGLLRVGQKVEMKVMRNGKAHNIRAVVEQPRATAIGGDKLHPRLAGAVIGDIIEGMPLYGKIDGVVVLEVEPGSPSWRAGLRSGDVIVQANRQNTANLAALSAVVRPKEPLLLNVQRREGALFILLQ
ncbi:DegQ family serine endoprotease [Sulfurivermis fontis]|uniref:DegQ family serine endoprotease n=1 Tax=Sulfurivermis fontis TaxID=1972068 RepID=UPI000FD941FB|nr:DegQ family serine endoprotease [Sulfurivermis fontis]